MKLSPSSEYLHDDSNYEFRAVVSKISIFI